MTPNSSIATLGRYEILAELGQGAMGVVYKARNLMLDRVVAIKTVSLTLPKDELAEYEARFYQEAEACSGVSSPATSSPSTTSDAVNESPIWRWSFSRATNCASFCRRARRFHFHARWTLARRLPKACSTRIEHRLYPSRYQAGQHHGVARRTAAPKHSPAAPRLQ